MKAVTAAMEPEKYYVGQNSPIFSKIGGAKEKLKEKKKQIRKKKKEILNFKLL